MFATPFVVAITYTVNLVPSAVKVPNSLACLLPESLHTCNMTSLADKVPEICAKVGYDELYGYHFETKANWGAAHDNIVKKFLKANKNDVTAAALQLEKTLQWRKEFRPLEAAKEEHDPKLEQLALITRSPSEKIVTWNLYGAIRTVDERSKLFGELEKFLRWRVGVMERGISYMDLGDKDLCQMDQVHDYLDISMFKLDAATKKASSATIKVFQDHYPEFLAAKFFVNVPLLMSWMFAFAKTFMSQETADKMHVVGNGKDLAYVLGEWVPAQYGGKGPSLVALAENLSNEVKQADKATEKPATTTAPTPVAADEKVATEPAAPQPGAVPAPAAEPTGKVN